MRRRRGPAGCQRATVLNDAHLPEDPEGQAEDLLNAIADSLAERGWGVFPHALPPALSQSLWQRATSLEHYRPAGVGRQARHRRNRFVRNDETAWIEGDSHEEAAWLDWAERLREHLNKSLFLGLTEFETHFARYAPGAFYARHRDAFRGSENRVVSLVLYLNPAWQPADGGQLVLYDDRFRELGRFEPELGTVAVFLSEQHPHEVLATERPRHSIAGWFRRREANPVLAGAQN